MPSQGEGNQPGKQVCHRLMKGVLERDGWRCWNAGPLENLQAELRLNQDIQKGPSLKTLWFESGTEQVAAGCPLGPPEPSAGAKASPIEPLPLLPRHPRQTRCSQRSGGESLTGVTPGQKKFKARRMGIRRNVLVV